MLFDVMCTVLQIWVGQPPLVPNPEPVAPPGELANAANTLLAWMKWGGIVGAVASATAAGIMMVVGRRNRNHMAIEGAVSLPWVVAGLALVLGSASVISFLLQ